MLGRFIFNRIGAVVIGALFVIVGLVAFSGSQVKCGSEVMSPGDICTATSNGNSVDRTYDEQKSDNQRTQYIILAVGGVIIVGGIIANVRHFAKKKAEVPATPTAPAAV
jgi:hypothetical protein